MPAEVTAVLFGLAAAATYAPRGLRINGVAPGLTKTPLTERLWSSERAAEASRALHPLGRLGEPEMVAGAIAWLLLRILNGGLQLPLGRPDHIGGGQGPQNGLAVMPDSLGRARDTLRTRLLKPDRSLIAGQIGVATDRPVNRAGLPCVDQALPLV